MTGNWRRGALGLMPRADRPGKRSEGGRVGGWCGLERPVLSQCSRTGGSMGAQRRDPARFPPLRSPVVCRDY